MLKFVTVLLLADFCAVARRLLIAACLQEAAERGRQRGWCVPAWCTHCIVPESTAGITTSS
jgi:hypothetical protein